MKHNLLIIAVCVMCCGALAARIKTTRGGLRTRTTVSKDIVVDTIPTIGEGDSVNVQFRQGAIRIKGFSKRAADWKESFFVCNGASHRITHVTLKLRYTDMTGNMLHERTVTVACDLKPGETKQVQVKSFDTHGMFYYYAGSKPRKSATPFRVQAHVVSYDMPIDNPMN